MATLVHIELIVTKLKVIQLPAFILESLHPGAPLARRKLRAGPDPLAKLDAVGQLLYRPPFWQHNFMERKAGDWAKSITARVN